MASFSTLSCRHSVGLGDLLSESVFPFTGVLEPHDGLFFFPSLSKRLSGGNEGKLIRIFRTAAA